MRLSQSCLTSPHTETVPVWLRFSFSCRGLRTTLCVQTICRTGDLLMIPVFIIRIIKQPEVKKLNQSVWLIKMYSGLHKLLLYLRSVWRQTPNTVQQWLWVFFFLNNPVRHTERKLKQHVHSNRKSSSFFFRCCSLSFLFFGRLRGTTAAWRWSLTQTGKQRSPECFCDCHCL